jgi:hypothetical protein
MNYYRKIFWQVLCFTCLSINLVACNSTSKQKAADIDRIASIYSDLVLTSLNDISTDSLAHLQAVLDKHGMTREEFENQLSEIEKQPELWASILTKVVDELKKHDPSAKTITSPSFTTQTTSTKK